MLESWAVRGSLLPLHLSGGQEKWECFLINLQSQKKRGGVRFFLSTRKGNVLYLLSVRKREDIPFYYTHLGRLQGIHSPAPLQKVIAKESNASLLEREGTRLPLGARHPLIWGPNPSILTGQ